MTNFIKIHCMNTEKLAKFLESIDKVSEGPWWKWFSRKYCKECNDKGVFACDDDGKCAYDDDSVSVIKGWLEDTFTGDTEESSDVENDFAGELLSVPCKLGQIVYVIPTKENRLSETTAFKVTGFSISDCGNVANCIRVKGSPALFQPAFEEFGVSVFLSMEGANKGLEHKNEVKDDENN